MLTIMEMIAARVMLCLATGHAFASTVNLSTLDGTNGFRLDGEAAGDQSGCSVSSAGDVNGDGYDDLIIGAWYADNNGNASGSSYVVFGYRQCLRPTVNLSTLDGTNGFRLDGEAAVIIVATQSPVRATLTVTAMMT